MGTERGRRRAIGEQVGCSCCGRTRFWAELGTFTTDLSSDFDLADGTLTQTVLYCSDDSECRGTAQTLRLIPATPVAISHARGNADAFAQNEPFQRAPVQRVLARAPQATRNVFHGQGDRQRLSLHD
jgi:hypothetical protein